ncbi:hypothetical protein [Dictyobacter vulcani]|uniref:hypothetical protein n=1 Tax=Dictyobacter vulcani TaxID=2607529 RepID=UPI001386937B|nr:hypothetical protein [Dictyobacter vulcani]
MPVAPPPRRILCRDPLREGTGGSTRSPTTLLCEQATAHTIPGGATALRSRSCTLACANAAGRPPRVAPTRRTHGLLVTSNLLSTSR